MRREPNIHSAPAKNSPYLSVNNPTDGDDLELRFGVCHIIGVIEPHLTAAHADALTVDKHVETIFIHHGLPMDETMDRLAQAQRSVEELLDSKRYDFDGLKPSDLEDRLPVVYAIFDKVDGACLYVGRTKNLRRRLYTNHLMGPETNARLKKYLIEDLERKDIDTMAAAKYYLIDQCYFQYLAVPDMRMRGQIEGLLSYLLDVRYIHEEH